MSALNLIIARGFGPEVQQLGTIMGDEKNRQQAHNTDERSAEINQRGAVQRQQTDGGGYIDWLYLDEGLRVTRGNKGSLFVHTREESI